MRGNQQKGLHSVLSTGQVVESGSKCMSHFGIFSPILQASCRESLLIVKEILMAHSLCKSLIQLTGYVLAKDKQKYHRIHRSLY